MLCRRGCRGGSGASRSVQQQHAPAAQRAPRCCRRGCLRRRRRAAPSARHRPSPRPLPPRCCCRRRRCWSRQTGRQRSCQLPQAALGGDGGWRRQRWATRGRCCRAAAAGIGVPQLLAFAWRLGLSASGCRMWEGLSLRSLTCWGLQSRNWRAECCDRLAGCRVAVSERCRCHECLHGQLRPPAAAKRSMRVTSTFSHPANTVGSGASAWQGSATRQRLRTAQCRAPEPQAPLWRWPQVRAAHAPAMRHQLSDWNSAAAAAACRRLPAACLSTVASASPCLLASCRPVHGGHRGPGPPAAAGHHACGGEPADGRVAGGAEQGPPFGQHERLPAGTHLAPRHSHLPRCHRRLSTTRAACSTHSWAPAPAT